MADEHFHEIQLSGKQLVFLFMATAVVAVVIFLTGVMVGRGVRAEREFGVAADLLAASPEVPAAAQPPGGATDDPRGAAPAASGQANGARAADEFSYYAQLEGQTPKAASAAKTRPITAESDPVVSESAPPASAVPPAAAADSGASAQTTAPAAGAASRSDTAVEPGTGSGDARAGEWAVQVAALVDGAAAEAEAKKLVARGYPAYVVAPAADARSPIFRVRVGHFATRRDAEEMKRRLEKDRYKPLITR